jgi:nucleoside-diphosphate-sugar epimerase
MQAMNSKKWVIVTGAAGFIGSRLSELLLKNYNVIGIDNFHDYYDSESKKRNLEKVKGFNSFKFLERDITNLEELDGLPKLEGIFHLAAQPGVRESWKDGFRSYAINNVFGTQQMLDFAVRTETERFIYSSSSSVYGDSLKSPTRESDQTSPISPYGVSKLTGELLANSYAKTNHIKVRSLRYFTVYGPGQRPDMAIHRLINASLKENVFTLYGDGTQSRDFTYIDDVARANIEALETPQNENYEVFNVGGGEGISLSSLISAIEQKVGKKLKISPQPKSKGDVQVTMADISAIGLSLGWKPRVKFMDGLEEQVKWQKSLL